ncbi:DUF4190 domain-containing protein [Streptomyces sp. CB02115]|uniref:DUF4190 domain-containing protein n=1 Tax=Streptomyces sp. CB02115 TaxID=1703939 RepID=UPI000AF248C9|nr:DUF4190 domain-containing protein [Streptomyces sp. CB02115]
MNAQGIEAPLNHTVSPQGRAERPRTAPSGRAHGPTAPKNSLATAALTSGVIGLCTSVVLIGGPLSVCGLLLGIAALITARRTGVGRGRAVTAVVASSLAIVVSGLVTVFMIWYANKTQECYQPDSFHQYTQCVRAHLNGN